MSPVERAARALARHESGTDCYDGLDEAMQQTLQESVRVVLEAVREPSEDQVREVIAAFDHAHWDDCFPQAAKMRDMLASIYGLPSMKAAISK